MFQFHLNGDYQDRGYSAMKYRPFSLGGEFLRAHGGVLVRAEIKRSRAERVVLTALNPVRVCLSGPGLPQREVSLQKGGVQTIQPD